MEYQEPWIQWQSTHHHFIRIFGRSWEDNCQGYYSKPRQWLLFYCSSPPLGYCDSFSMLDHHCLPIISQGLWQPSQECFDILHTHTHAIKHYICLTIIIWWWQIHVIKIINHPYLKISPAGSPMVYRWLSTPMLKYYHYECHLCCLDLP